MLRAAGRGLVALVCALLALPAAAPDALAQAVESAPDDGFTQLLGARADEMLVQITALRNRPPLQPVDRQMMSGAALRERLIRIVARDYTRAQIDAEEDFFVTLGLLPPEIDYYDLILDLHEEQVAGLYDPVDDVLLVRDELPLSALEPVLSHELFHAIQDQYWDLEALMASRRHTTDTALATSALAEGDALAVMFEVSMGGLARADQIPGLDAMLLSSLPERAEATDVPVPEVMWQQLIFPYVAGFGYILNVARDGGWEAVDALYDHPPSSTEQILHPLPAGRRDEPTWLHWPELTEPIGRRVRADILGEWTIRHLLAQLLEGTVSGSAAQRAAEGWDGDRVEVFAEGDARWIVWATVWDTTHDARQFERVAARLSLPWVGATTERSCLDAGGTLWAARGALGEFALVRQNDQVVVVARVAPPAGEGGESAVDEPSSQRTRSLATAVSASLERTLYPSELAGPRAAVGSHPE